MAKIVVEHLWSCYNIFDVINVHELALFWCWYPQKLHRLHSPAIEPWMAPHQVHMLLSHANACWHAHSADHGVAVILCTYCNLRPGLEFFTNLCKFPVGLPPLKKAPTSTKHKAHCKKHRAQSTCTEHRAQSTEHKAHAQTKVYGLQVFTKPIQALGLVMSIMAQPLPKPPVRVGGPILNCYCLEPTYV